MSLLIRQRIFSLTDTYDVCDHTGRPRYFVKAEFFTIGHKIHIYDSDSGAEVGRIQERVFTFLAKAELSVRGVPWLVTRQFTLFKPRYTIDNGWEIEGDFLGWNYRIVDRAGAPVATIEAELFHFSDTYTLTVTDPSNELTALMVAITIDMMNCRNS